MLMDISSGYAEAKRFVVAIMPSHSSREHLGLLLGVIGMATFGGTLPATRIAVSAIDPLALTSLRTAIAGLASLALLLVLRRLGRRADCGRNSPPPCSASVSRFHS